jgi:hypothetical protein
MYVYMYVCMYACMHVCMYVCNTLQLTALQEAEIKQGFNKVQKTGGLVVLCCLEFHFTGAN